MPLVLALSLLGGGCAQNVEVQTTFPDPLVEPLPLTVGVHFTEELTNYSYSEELPADNVDWHISLGNANKLLFDSIFSEVFTRAIPVNAAAASGVDAVVEPGIEAFEFSLPRHSGSNQYAVWISYTVSVYGPDGELRTRWPVKAYGEVDSRRFKGNATMRAATVLAMRDAATIIIQGLNHDTAFRRAVFGQSLTTDSDQPAPEFLDEEEPDQRAVELGQAADGAQPGTTGEEWNSES